MVLYYQVYFDILKEAGTTEDELVKKLQVHGVLAMTEGPHKYVSSYTFSTFSIFANDENQYNTNHYKQF